MAAVVGEKVLDNAAGIGCFFGYFFVAKLAKSRQEGCAPRMQLCEKIPERASPVPGDLLRIPAVLVFGSDFPNAGMRASADLAESGCVFRLPRNNVSDDVLQSPFPDEWVVDIADAARLDVPDELVAFQLKFGHEAAALISAASDVVVAH
jgi:hypothetical protein